MTAVATEITTHYSVTDARAALPEILNQVEAGAVIQITRRGQPVVVLLSQTEYDRAVERRKPSLSQAFKAWCQKNPPDGTGLDREFIASLRDKSPATWVDFGEK